MVFEVSDNFLNNACKHCASLLIIPSKLDHSINADDTSATITFIEYDNRTFGVTCKHVVEILRKYNAEAGNQFAYTFFIALEKSHVIQDRFVLPQGDWITPAPDIAIREINPNLPEHLGKVAIDIEPTDKKFLKQVKFGIAVGFPDKFKKEVKSPGGYRLSMQCVHILAENQSDTGHSFTLFSDLEITPKIRDFSGMSGGPIYWSSESDYGLLGITYESPTPEDALSDNVLHVKGHTLNKEILKSWIVNLPNLSFP